MNTFYIIVNADLKMKKGKIAAQVSHVTRMAFSDSGASKTEVNRAIVLKAGQDKIEYLIAKYATGKAPTIVYVIDAGLTQVDPGSITCMAVIPGCPVPSELKQLKLL